MYVSFFLSAPSLPKNTLPFVTENLRSSQKTAIHHSFHVTHHINLELKKKSLNFASSNKK